MTLPVLAEFLSRNSPLTKRLSTRNAAALRAYPNGLNHPWWLESSFFLFLMVPAFFASPYLGFRYGIEVGVLFGLVYASLWGWLFITTLRRDGSASLLAQLSKAIEMLEGCSRSRLEDLCLLNELELQSMMNRLMIEVCEPVFDLQEQSAKANPLDWRPKHAKLMAVVKERFDTLKVFGYMPQGGYGLFFQHIRYLRDGQPEKCILAT